MVIQAYLRIFFIQRIKTENTGECLKSLNIYNYTYCYIDIKLYSIQTLLLSEVACNNRILILLMIGRKVSFKTDLLAIFSSLFSSLPVCGFCFEVHMFMGGTFAFSRSFVAIYSVVKKVICQNVSYFQIQCHHQLFLRKVSDYSAFCFFQLSGYLVRLYLLSLQLFYIK